MLNLVKLELAVKPCIRAAALHLPEDPACHGQAQSSTYKSASNEERWVAEQDRHRDAQNHPAPPTNTDCSPHFISSEAAHDYGLPIKVVGEEVERSILQVSGLSHVASPVRGRQ